MKLLTWYKSGGRYYMFFPGDMGIRWGYIMELPPKDYIILLRDFRMPDNVKDYIEKSPGPIHLSLYDETKEEFFNKIFKTGE